MEYKFRAKNKDSGKWEYGYYVKYIRRQVSPIGDFLDESDVVHLIFQSGFADWNMERPLNAVEIIPETVGMFTGLTDKNSVEIYEGDVVMYRYEYIADIICGTNRYETEAMECEVCVRNGAYWIQPMAEPAELDMYFLGEVHTNCEVIGNIHD